jgi:DNA-binding NtrC family response regulator
VRQLRNHLERAAALGTIEGLPNDDLPADVPDPRLPYAEARQAAVAAFERRYLAMLVDRHGGNVSAAARAANLNRTYLHDLLRRHGLRGG